MVTRLANEKSIYVVAHDPEYGLNLSWTPGAHQPVQLALVTSNHEALGQSLEDYRKGANLVVQMDQAALMALYSKIRDFARTMDWPLPKEDETQA